MENDYINIKLSEYGIYLIKEKYKKDFSNNNSMYPSSEMDESEEFEVNVDKNGYSNLSLKDVVHVFRDHLNDENKPFVDEDIVVKLSNQGKSILNMKFYDDYLVKHNDMPDDNVVFSQEFEIPIDENGYSEFKLSSIITMFGPFIDETVPFDEIKVKSQNKTK